MCNGVKVSSRATLGTYTNAGYFLELCKKTSTCRTNIAVVQRLEISARKERTSYQSTVQRFPTSSNFFEVEQEDLIVGSARPRRTRCSRR